MKAAKPWSVSILITLTLITAIEAAAVATVKSGSPEMRLEIEGEAKTLAKGFEAAFQRLPAGAKYVEILTASGQKYLEGSVKSVEAMDGVLLIATERGFVYAINARKVAAITNAGPNRPGD